MKSNQITQHDVDDHSDVYKHIPDFVEYASTHEDEPLEPVQVITTQQYFKEKAYDEAWDIVNDPNDIEAVAEQICKEKYVDAQEMVEIFRDRVTIIVHAKTITTIEIERALSLLASVENFSPGNIFKFGERRKILYEFATEVSSNSSF